MVRVNKRKNKLLLASIVVASDNAEGHLLPLYIMKDKGTVSTTAGV